MFGNVSDSRATFDPLAINSGFYEPTATDLLAAEDDAASPSGIYEPFSERDPRKKLNAVISGEGVARDEEASETELPLLTKFSGFVVSAFVALSVLLGISRAVKRPEVSAEPDPGSKDAASKGKLYDAEHLLSYDEKKRSQIVDAWKTLPDKFKIAVIEGEMKGLYIKGDATLPPFPPRLWATRMAWVIDAQSGNRNDLTTAQGLFEEARLSEMLSQQFAGLHLYERAASSAMAAGFVFESYERSLSDGGSRSALTSALDSYRSAEVHAEFAGKATLQAAAVREAERVWVKLKLIEKLGEENSLAGEKTYVRAVSDVMSRRAVEDPFFGSKFLMRKPFDEPGDGFTFPAIDSKNFDAALAEVKAELALGLAPNWRAGLEKFFYEIEDPMYLELQKWSFYPEITKEEAADFAPLVVKALEDSGFREKYLTKDGMVSHEGLLAVRDARMGRIAATPSGERSSHVTQAGRENLSGEGNLSEQELGLQEGWKKGIEAFFLLNEEPGYKEFQPSAWYAELVKDTVADFAPLVMKALKEESFRDKYLRDGLVTEEGLKEVLLKEQKRIGALPPGSLSSASAALPDKAEKVSELSRERRAVQELILNKWNSEKDRMRILSRAIREGGRVVELGEQGEMLPVKWILENFRENQLSEDLRKAWVEEPLKISLADAMPKLLADKEIKGYLDSLSKPERKAFLNEQFAEWKRIGRNPDVVSWMRTRVGILRQIDFAEIAREADERVNERKMRRMRKDRSNRSLMIENAKKGKVKGK